LCIKADFDTVSDRKKRVESLDKRRVTVKQVYNALNDTGSVDPIEGRL
jgi:hypothetical protein